VALRVPGIVFGMNHYTNGTCGSKYGTYTSSHPSFWEPTRTLAYPVCNGQQITTNGLFWIAVR
jgi:hypothetical protein